MATFSFELVSPERLLFSGEVNSVVVPGTEGTLTVLAQHEPFMTSIRPGIITVTQADGHNEQLFIRGGFCDIGADGLTILAEQAIPVKDVSEDVLNHEVELAEAEFEAAHSPEERRAAAEKLSQIIELRHIPLPW
jgi:F-type H+-transporting ATPase subunit epsilon